MKITVLASSSAGNLYKIEDGKTTLLIECGLPIKEIKKALNYKLYEVDACLISHEHGDHAKGAKDLEKAGIDLYASQGTFEALGLDGHRTHVLKAKKSQRIGSYMVTPFDVNHDAMEPLGFQIVSLETNTKLVFITDTNYVKYTFNDMDYLMIEANYDLDVINRKVDEGSLEVSLRNRIRHSHMSLQQVLKFLEANDLNSLKAVYLLHLSDGNSDEDKMKREVQRATGVPVYIY